MRMKIVWKKCVKAGEKERVKGVPNSCLGWGWRWRENENEDENSNEMFLLSLSSFFFFSFHYFLPLPSLKFCKIYKLQLFSLQLEKEIQRKREREEWCSYVWINENLILYEMHEVEMLGWEIYRERKRKRKEETEIERVISGQVLMRYYICMHFQWLMTLRGKDERERKNEKLHPMTDDDGKLQLFFTPSCFQSTSLSLLFIPISFFLFFLFFFFIFLFLRSWYREKCSIIKSDIQEERRKKERRKMKERERGVKL